MSQISGGRAVVETLITLGARRGFGVPGESFLSILDAFCDNPHFEFTSCRNEGGASFMAEAWAKLTGEVGLCFVTRGPGATNASIGVHTAMQASTPMILFIGQVGLEHQGREAFQELDYRQIFGAIAKYSTEITDVNRTSEVVRRAWSMAISGRPGPVVVALPEDILTQLTNIIEPSIRPILPPVAGAMPDDLETVAKKLKTARRPVILVGGGGWRVEDRTALHRFSVRLNVPVVTAFRYHDLFDNTLPLFLGEAGVGMTDNTRKVLLQADVIIAVNVRFGEMTTDAFKLFNNFRDNQWIVQTHLSGDEFHKYVSPDLTMISSPISVLEGLNEILEPAVLSFDLSWIKAARNGFEKGQQPQVQPGLVDMGLVITMIQKLLPSDAIITNGAGNFAIWPNKFMQFSAKQRLLAPQSGAMGYGLPAAIAAKLEQPDRCVLCFSGDGDFQMNFQELGTALQSNARPIVLILNNGTYGTIRMHQEKNYPSRVSGTDLINPDFVMLGKAYGCYAARIEKTEDFAACFECAMASPSGAVLDIKVAAEAITPSLTIDDLRRVD